jgi:hypothetical protein
MPTTLGRFGAWHKIGRRSAPDVADAAAGYAAAVSGIKCTQCSATDLESGFLQDLDRIARDAQWIPGPLERGLLGGARRMGRQRRQIDAFRCTQCGHLELFAGTTV